MTTSTSPALPSAWIDRIFSRLSGIYGSKFVSQWAGCDIENVRNVWAEELAGFRDLPEAIGYALKNLDPVFPPSALEFRALCRKAPRKDAPLALPHKPTAEELERQHEMAKKVAEATQHRPGFDPMDWAKHPRSRLSMGVVATEAKKGRDSRFREIFTQLVAEGRVTEEGQALQLWDGTQWVRA